MYKCVYACTLVCLYVPGPPQSAAKAARLECMYVGMYVCIIVIETMSKS